MEKFYSEVTKKSYLTKEAKEAEEKAYNLIVAEKENKQKELAEAKAARLKEIAEQEKKMNAEIDKYNELINKFNADYSGYHYTYRAELKRPESLFDFVISNLFF